MKNEKEIINAFRNRNDAAFQQIYNELYASVVYFVNSIIKNQLESEDIVVNSFVKLWEQDVTEYHTFAKIKNFIYIVSKNAALGYLRRSKVVGKYISTLEEEHVFEVAELEYMRIESQVLASVIKEINNFPPRTKQVFEMMYFQNLNSLEISRLLNISDKTVRSLKFYAITRLKNKYSHLILP